MSDVARKHGASGAVLDEVVAYCAHPYSAQAQLPCFPLADEPHIERWRLYARDAEQLGAFAALEQRFAQLQFPIEAGISATDAYRAATRRGEPVTRGASEPALHLSHADAIRLEVFDTFAGAVPVISVPHRGDFVSLVQAFTERNEPAAVPDSMGACIVTGFNNWDRIRAYRSKWTEEHGTDATAEAWAEQFQRLIPQKPLYQDRFIILSHGPYSATRAEDVGTAEDEWLRQSLCIRREHEFTHYFTYRVFGVLRSHIADELIADFVGLVRTFGRYRDDLAARFLGLEAFPPYRRGGRLEGYRGRPPVSEAAFAVLASLAHAAIGNLATVARLHRDRLESLATFAPLVHALCTFALDDLAADDFIARLQSRLPSAS